MADAVLPTLPARFAPPPLDAPLSASSSSIKKTSRTSHPLEALAVLTSSLAFIFETGAVAVWLFEVFSPSELGDLEFVLILDRFPSTQREPQHRSDRARLVCSENKKSIVLARPHTWVRCVDASAQLDATGGGAFPTVIYFFQDKGFLT